MSENRVYIFNKSYPCDFTLWPSEHKINMTCPHHAISHVKYESSCSDKEFSWLWAKTMFTFFNKSDYCDIYLRPSEPKINKGHDLT